jgi:hypothetical protein
MNSGRWQRGLRFGEGLWLRPRPGCSRAYSAEQTTASKPFPAIRTPWSRRWREFRIEYVPPLAFCLTVAAVVALWRQHVLLVRPLELRPHGGGTSTSFSQKAATNRPTQSYHTGTFSAHSPAGPR